MNVQNRFKSKVAWISTLTLITFIFKNYMDLEIQNVDKLIELILVTATAWGIFNNPEKKGEY